MLAQICDLQKNSAAEAENPIKGRLRAPGRDRYVLLLGQAKNHAAIPKKCRHSEHDSMNVMRDQAH
jgi:hypothetical protein